LSGRFSRGDAGQSIDLKLALRQAVQAARLAGSIMGKYLHSTKRANSITQHDIKLELDVRCQKLIERTLFSAFPEIGSLGEEGSVGNTQGDYRWVVDPIDGTVNFAYGVPHACVAIALQRRINLASKRGAKGIDKTKVYPDGYQTILGVVYEPFCNELWTATIGQRSRLNGKPVCVSRRRTLDDSIVCIGLSKTPEHLEATLPLLDHLARRVRKIRIMGAGALDLTYVATGRFDAYIEKGIRLWDIAAGGLILECAGGEISRDRIHGEHAYRMIASNGILQRELEWLDKQT
jgi:myo-inositol-1(or 4)-monophosphatase